VQVTGTNLNITYVVLAISLLALAIAWVLRAQVLAASEGTEKMREIAEAVQEGAAAYLARQFRTLSYFVGIVFFLLFALPADTTSIRIGRSLFFLMGAGFSALVGYNGMWLAVRANVRVAEAARQKSAEKAVQIAFRTGGVVGMTTVGLGLIGAAGAVVIFRENAPTVLEGFGFGAAMLAMFMRVGGGIFTKAADVGADLVGKVEKGIPEDDPRNPATIADNVGDNVGDCAGMAADLFESYAVTLVAALILGKAAFGNEGLIYPLIVPAIGILTAVIGIFLTKMRPTDKSAMNAINRSFFLSAIISAGLTGLATFTYLPAKFDQLTNFSPKVLADAGNINPRVLALGAVLIGIALAAAIQVLTGFFTEVGKRPVNDVAASSQTGAATVLLAGISVGFESAVYSALLIAASVFGAFLLGGGSITLSLFAIAIAGTGLLTTVGVIVAMDTFGPISDNAQGIAEMSGDVKGEGAQILTSLDAVGNTTKAITKGIAIATAVLAATALFGAFTDAIKEAVIKAVGEGADVALQFQGVLDVADPRNLVGLIIGAAVVFLFSGLAQQVLLLWKFVTSSSCTQEL
jgi:K(+)-stimulated pyrophosphate-energized sodium pump